jgi:hypothetical protein
VGGARDALCRCCVCCGRGVAAETRRCTCYELAVLDLLERHLRVVCDVAGAAGGNMTAQRGCVLSGRSRCATPARPVLSASFITSLPLTVALSPPVLSVTRTTGKGGGIATRAVLASLRATVGDWLS